MSLAYSAYFFGESLVFSIIYLWSREVPDQQARAVLGWHRSPACRPRPAVLCQRDSQASGAEFVAALLGG